MKQKKTLLLVILSIAYIGIHAQVADSVLYTKSYSDLEVEYFPQLIFCKTRLADNFNAKSFDFEESLENLLFVCSQKKFKLVTLSERTSRLWGIPPKDARVGIEIEESGLVKYFGIMGLDNVEKVNSCLLQAINECIVKPAIIDCKPVKCYLSYWLKEI